METSADRSTGNSEDLLRTAADRLEALAARTTPGDWRLTGLLASRPEVVAARPDGSTEHVAEARAASGAWIAALSPAVAAPLAAALRSAAEQPAGAGHLADLADLLLSRIPETSNPETSNLGP